MSGELRAERRPEAVATVGTRYLAARRIKVVLLVALMVLVALAFLVPFYWMSLSAFRSLADIFAYPTKWLPSDFTIDNYTTLFAQTRFLRSYLNSIIVTVSYIAISLAICSLGGYGLAKYRFAGRNAIFVIFLSTIMIPPVLFLLPQYLIIRSLHLINSYPGLILPGTANIAGLFLLRQYFLTVPDELIEAGRIDGCSEPRIYSGIILPVVRSGHFVGALILFGAAWNNFLWPKIVVTTDSMATLTVMISLIQGMSFEKKGVLTITPYNILMAASFLIVLPLAILFIRFAGFLRQSVIQAALKG
ncbi:MAG TPA: carbohydrate ABC transporter permease [Spirochaetia bacterium]|nr:carbohydrate ABC transporter permease [Spirochaetia bacterium]HUZ16901.1 carbohydrate ABC transporter permease [Spirochaetia bacterium]